MALGIRGANPIWLEVDLQGNLFDDTFYLFVLENTIPYIPATVYHDPDLNVPWTQPIRFLGNGTLPVDIYFEADVVYRLEFRQGPTQQDPLIYEVNNYVAGSGGSTPIDTVAFASSNQITNPQFSLINFGTPAAPTFTLAGTDPDPIHIAPGWFLTLAGTGTVTITQVPLNNANTNPSNAPYALRLTLNGWTNDSVILWQRFEQNGMLWANKIVSSTVTARLEGSPQSIIANLVDSNDSLLANVLALTPVNEAWNEFTGHGDLPATTNPDVPPAAYIDYRLSLPSNIDIYLSSFQLVVQDLPIEPAFEQDSINRQIDHTYNTAYPIMPVGTVIDFAGFDIPLHYLDCNGQAASRTVYNQLFQALTHLETVTLTATSNTFTVVSAANYRIGMPIENAAIPAATTISGISGTTITMSAAATVTGTAAVRFFGTGAGNGTTTFNTPDLRDFVTAGLGGSLFGTSLNGVGGSGGASTHVLTVAELPNPVATGVGVTNVTAAGAVSVIRDNATGSGIVSNPTGGNAMSLVQQTALMRKCIRFE